MKTRNSILVGGIALLAAPSVHAAETVDAVLGAMDFGGFSNVVDQSNAQTLDVRSSLGGIQPRNGADMAFLFTGDVDLFEGGQYPPDVGDWFDTEKGAGLQPSCDPSWDADLGAVGEADDEARFSFDLLVPATANSIEFDLYFLTREYPEFVGNIFNDSFEVNLTGTAWSGQIVFDALGNPVSINSALFDVVFTPADPNNPVWDVPENPLRGTSFDVDGGTGWLTTIAPVDPGDTINLEFRIRDVQDGLCDSGVLLDHLRFSEDDPTDPVTGDDDDDDDDSAAGDDDDAVGDDDDSATGDDDDDAPLPFLSGSGCPDSSLAGRPSSNLLALAFGLVVSGIVARRRNRRRSSPRGRAALILLALALVAVPLSTAEAQDSGPALDVQRFDPVPQGRGFTLVRDAAQPDRFEVSSFLAIHFGLNPLQVSDPSDFSRLRPVVDHLLGFDLGVSVAPTKWLQLGVQVPFLQLQPLSPEAAGNAAVLGHSGGLAGVGDTTLAAAFGVLRQGDNAPISLALAPRMVLPTGHEDMFLSSNAFGLGGDLAVGGRHSILHWSANVGFQVNTFGQATANLRPDDEFRWGLALGVVLLDDQIEIDVEWVGATVISPAAHAELGIGPFAPTHTPSELNLSALIHPNRGPVWFRVGAGPGIGAGFGTPDLRVFGIVGVDVACPTCKEGEPRIVEKIVEAPMPLDPDEDGVKGKKDLCPYNPEDLDGFEDDDGCPEWDNDHDTVHDACDKCPTEKEVLNGVDDHDGCPDESLAQIDLEKQEIVILDKVYFDLDKDTIKKASHPVLDAVYAVLSNYPSIEGVEVQGHTDSRAADDYNLDLSQRRANAVRKYLMAKGIEGERLVSKGYGETTPLVPDAATEEDHARNRRVQFVITKTGAGAPEVKDAKRAQPTAEE